MEIETFLTRVRAGKPVTFDETMQLIDEHYIYRPVAFSNGPAGAEIHNPAGTNEGSCRIFAFARRHGLTVAETLALFGDYYRRDVLENPASDNHANIRTFMRHGWKAIHFSDDPLSPR